MFSRRSSKVIVPIHTKILEINNEKIQYPHGTTARL
ncbi:hypothetical protein FSU_2640 [Fibrobacter succinogenes subsp. succinogenes S85]|uniref:Uncharacterized protein n=1 Tax=Fibrobacter succinogenes (strain ATCC 19169 / S85) TaxID=59374 RepID=D9S643_FIBSS|nr:hypothetical protein FSU_2640 [Fibrobacter succinogenes subsp. succinogenes S85]